MKPKFEIGEEVILQSQSYPECNGEAVVISIHNTRGAIDRQGVRHCVGGFAYLLTIESPVEGKRWHELAIKKKQQKGDMCFKALINSLNTKIQEKV